MDENQIEFYLNNKEALYKDWYVGQVQHETGIDHGVPYGSFSDWKCAFNSWVDQHQTDLRKVLCPHATEIIRQEWPLMAVSLIASLIEDLPYVGRVIETSCLLFVFGTKSLCDGYDQCG